MRLSWVRAPPPELEREVSSPEEAFVRFGVPDCVKIHGVWFYGPMGTARRAAVVVVTMVAVATVVVGIGAGPAGAHVDLVLMSGIG
jgi:hypothetical protein